MIDWESLSHFDFIDLAIFMIIEDSFHLVWVQSNEYIIGFMIRHWLLL